MKSLALSFITYALLGISFAYSDECWVASNVRGYSAASTDDYASFFQNGLDRPLLICFSAEGGTVTGNDLRLVKFGESTLAGFGANGRGNEVFVVYQIDRERKKLLFTLTRIGTRTITPVLPDIVEAFVGDVVQAPK